MINTNKNSLILLDSGIGGLSIFKKIKKYIPLNINFIYLMDNKKFPYGNKNYVYIAKRLFKIIKYFTKIYIIKILIIACNTASIVTLKYLKKKFRFKIIGIFPAIKKSTKITNNKNILLIGTYITINSNYVNQIINSLPKFIIKKKYSSNLVKYAEKKIKTKYYNIKKIKEIFNNIINKTTLPDTIIIGCTHFSFLKKEFNKIFKKKIKYIDNINKIKKKIKKFFKTTKKIKNKNLLFLYTKKENFTKYFIKKIKFKYKFNIIKKININNK